MADNDNDLDDGQNHSSGSGLRKQLETALERLASLEKDNSDLREKTRSVDLATLFKSAGTRDGADALYPKDAEVSEEAVKAWVEKNAAFVRDESQSNGEQQQVSDQTRTNSQRLAQLADSGDRTLFDAGSIEQQIKDAKTPAELDAIYAQIGMKRT